MIQGRIQFPGDRDTGCPFFCALFAREVRAFAPGAPSLLSRFLRKRVGMLNQN
jgi:hypothetical protein